MKSETKSTDVIEIFLAFAFAFAFAGMVSAQTTVKHNINDQTDLEQMYNNPGCVPLGPIDSEAIRLIKEADLAARENRADDAERLYSELSERLETTKTDSRFEDIALAHISKFFHPESKENLQMLIGGWWHVEGTLTRLECLDKSLPEHIKSTFPETFTTDWVFQISTEGKRSIKIGDETCELILDKIQVTDKKGELAIRNIFMRFQQTQNQDIHFRNKQIALVLSKAKEKNEFNGLEGITLVNNDAKTPAIWAKATYTLTARRLKD